MTSSVCHSAQLRAWPPLQRLGVLLMCSTLNGWAAAQDGSDSLGEAPSKMEVTVVTGTRTPYVLSDSPVEVQVISAEDIEASGARDLAEYLEREGGVYANRVAGRGTEIQIQGLSSEHVLILVNGRRMVGRVNGAIDLTRLHVADIERVEIVKGPVSALYGADGLGGVVNIITRRDGSGGKLTLRGDNKGNRDAFAQWSFSYAGLSANISGGVSKLAGFDLDESTSAEDGVEGDSGFWGVSGAWQKGGNFTLGFDAAYSLDDTERQDAGSYETIKQIEETRLGLAPEWQFDAGRLTANVYYNRYYDQFLYDQLGSANNTIDEETLDEITAAGLQWDSNRVDFGRLPGAHTLTVGYDLQLEKLDADRLNQVSERERNAVYFQDDILLVNERLHLIPGLRFDKDSHFGEQLSPKLAMRYDIYDSLILRMGYGRGFRPPSFKELLLRFDNPGVGYRVVGNLDLEPERSTGVNMGLSWLGENQTVSVSTYHNRVEDLIEIIQVAVQPQLIFSYRNVSRARVSGVDMQWSGRWESSWPVELKLGYGRLWTRDEQTGDPLSGRPEHRANLSLQLEKGDFAAVLRGTWTGKREFFLDLNSGGQPTPPGEADAYTLLDARLSWQGFGPLEIAVGAANIDNAGDPQYLAIQPRNYYLELNWSL